MPIPPSTTKGTSGPCPKCNVTIRYGSQGTQTIDHPVLFASTICRVVGEDTDRPPADHEFPIRSSFHNSSCATERRDATRVPQRCSSVQYLPTTRISTNPTGLAEIMLYAAQLGSMTQGQGTSTMEFSHYDMVPPMVQQQIVAKAKIVDDEDE